MEEKIYSGGKKMRNAKFHQGKNERQWKTKKRSEQEHMHTTFPDKLNV